MTCSALRYSSSYQHWHTHGFCALRSQLIAFSIRISELQKQWSLAVRNIVACIVYTSIHFIMTCLYLILILKWHILFVFWHNFRVKYRGYNQVVVDSQDIFMHTWEILNMSLLNWYTYFERVKRKKNHKKTGGRLHLKSLIQWLVRKNFDYIFFIIHS